MWVLTAACGGGGGAKPLADAPPAVDGADIDAAPQPVTLTVTANGAPRVGVRVYFLNPDSSLVASADTNTAGTASALMPLGGSVTAIDPFPQPQLRVVAINNNDLRTFIGVKAGDHLALTQNDPPAGISVTMTVAPSAGAQVYRVLTTCGTGELTAAVGSAAAVNPTGVVNLAGCGAATDLTVLADTFEGLSGVLYKTGVAVADGGNVDLTKEAYAAATDRTFTYTNTPDAQLNLAHYLVTGRGKLGPFGGQIGTTTTVSEPAAAGAVSIADSSLRIGATLHDVVDWGALAASYAIDLNGVLLPDLSAIELDASKARIAWTPGATGAAPDLTISSVSITRGETRSYTWTLVAPYAAGALALPTLPKDVFDWNPQATDQLAVSSLVTAKVPGGYDAVRAHALDLDLSNDVTPLAGAVPGRAVIAQYSPIEAVRGLAAPARASAARLVRRAR